MSSASSKFCCPECGFLIHNRAYPKCERCKANLPAGLLLSKEEMDRGWNSLVAERAKERATKTDERWWSRKVDAD